MKAGVDEPAYTVKLPPNIVIEATVPVFPEIVIYVFGLVTELAEAVRLT